MDTESTCTEDGRVNREDDEEEDEEFRRQEMEVERHVRTDNDKYFNADYYVSNNEALVVNGRSSLTEQTETISRTYRRGYGKERNGAEKADDDEQLHRQHLHQPLAKALSICSTHIESICGNVASDTHSVSVCVQTEDGPLEQQEKHHEKSSSEEIAKCLANDEKAFMEFRSSSEPDTRTHAKEASKAMKTLHKRPNGNGLDDSTCPPTSTTVEDILSSSVAEESGCNDSGSRREAWPNNPRHSLPPRDDDRTENVGKPRAHQFCHIATSSGNSQEGHNQPCKNNRISRKTTEEGAEYIWGVRHDEEEKKEEDRSAIENTSHADSSASRQNRNTCSGSCQLCSSRTSGVLAIRDSAAGKPKGSTNVVCKAMGIRDNCPASAAVTCWINSSSDCCCCCCISSHFCPTPCHQHSSSCIQRTTPLCGAGRSETSTSENLAATATTACSPSSYSHNSLSARTSHVPHHCTTTKTVANNKVQQSTRSCCQRTTSELIKSVRPDNVLGGESGQQSKHQPHGKDAMIRVHGQEKETEVASKGCNDHKMNCSQKLNIIEGDGKKGLSSPNKNNLPHKLHDFIKPSSSDFQWGETKQQQKKQQNRMDKNRVGADTKTDKVEDQARTTAASGADDEAVEDYEEEADEEDRGQSTPETVINNNGEERQSPVDVMSSGGDDEAPSCEGVMEWARRKKRRVLSKMNTTTTTVEKHHQRNVICRNSKSQNVNSESTRKTQGNNISTNWSVTVAGCYYPNMAAPDLQMRLSFPGSQSAAVAPPKLPRHNLPIPHPALTATDDFVPELNLRHANENDSEDGVEEEEEGDFDYNEDSHGQVLPVINLVPKRKSLMRAPADDCKSIS